MAHAARAALPAITPSRMTGTRSAAAPMMKPARAACSNPPNAASIRIGSAASGWCSARPRRTTSTFLASVSLSTPVPRPVTSAASRPVKEQIRAADAVVLAIPMSPVSRHRLPAATRSRATSMPTPMAVTACSRLMAAPMVKSPVPLAILRGERIHDGPACQEVGHHLAGNLLRPRRDSLSVHTMISGEDRDSDGLRQRRRTAAGQPGQLHRYVLEYAERAGRLGHLRLPLPGRRDGIAVERKDRGFDLV